VAPPDSVLEAARNLGVEVYRQGLDFALVPGHEQLLGYWAGSPSSLGIVPDPSFGLEGARLANVATALAVVQVLGLGSKLSAAILERGLRATPAGRLQTIPGTPAWVLDVAHNAQSARELARWLGTHPVPGPTIAIVAIMADKRRAPMWEVLGEHVGGWVTTAIPSERALGAEALATELRQAGFGSVTVADDPGAAMQLASKQAGRDGRVLVFGSFLTVQAVAERWPPEAGHSDAAVESG
jgi:dihydrofolate synthase/folylpolyglutamate synthase